MMFTLTRHAYAKINGDVALAHNVFDAANHPSVSYPSRRHSGQWKHIKGDLCVVVDPTSNKIITFMENVVETDIRPDQADDPDAVEYQAKKDQRDRAKKAAKRRERQERDRALTSALKAGNKR